MSARILSPIAEFLEQNPDNEIAKSVLAPTYYRNPTPFLPFITERLRSTYFSHAKVSIVPYTLDPLKTCFIDFEREMLLFIIDRVKRADREGYFPPDLIAWIDLLCRLRSRYRHAYYSVHPDHYTGKLVDPALIELGLSGIGAIPIAALPDMGALTGAEQP